MQYYPSHDSTGFTSTTREVVNPIPLNNDTVPYLSFKVNVNITFKSIHGQEKGDLNKRLKTLSMEIHRYLEDMIGKEHLEKLDLTMNVGLAPIYLVNKDDLQSYRFHTFKTSATYSLKGFSTFHGVFTKSNEFIHRDLASFINNEDLLPEETKVLVFNKGRVFDIFIFDKETLFPYDDKITVDDDTVFVVD